MTSVYHPKPYTQLGRGVPVPRRTRGSKDCGPATIKMGLRQLTRGQLDPSIEEIRERMGKPGPVPTSTKDAERAVESYDLEMRPLDRKPLIYVRLKGPETEAMLRDAAKAGDFLQFAINYGTFNAELEGHTGDPNFGGGHSVGVHGWDRRRVRGGRLWRVVWQLFDPLDDERRAGIPDGPRWVRPSAVLAAWADLGHYAGILRGGERTL